MRTWAALAAALCAAGCAMAGPGGVARPALEAELLPPRTGVRAGRAVTLRLRLTNVSGRPLVLPSARFLAGFVTSSVRAPGGAESRVRHTGPAMGHGRFPGGELAPSASRVVPLAFTFDRPGVYRVQCRLLATNACCPWWSFWQGRAVSPPVAVAVRREG